MDTKWCIVCGHTICPNCKDWCDVINEDGDLCCGGDCIVSNVKPNTDPHFVNKDENEDYN